MVCAAEGRMGMGLAMGNRDHSATDWATFDLASAGPIARVYGSPRAHFASRRSCAEVTGASVPMGKSVTLPDLADRVADDIYSQRLTLSNAAKVLPIGNRAELGRWRGGVRKIRARVLS
jgi:hypothetical protein